MILKTPYLPCNKKNLRDKYKTLTPSFSFYRRANMGLVVKNFKLEKLQKRGKR